MSDNKEEIADVLAEAKAVIEKAHARTGEYAAEQGIVFTPPEPLKQRGIELLMKAIRKHGGSEADLTNHERNGAQARAACDLGWINGLDASAVDTMYPRVVTWLAQQVNDIIVAAWELPGE